MCTQLIQINGSGGCNSNYNLGIHYNKILISNLSSRVYMYLNVNQIIKEGYILVQIKIQKCPDMHKHIVDINNNLNSRLPVQSSLIL